MSKIGTSGSSANSSTSAASTTSPIGVGSIVTSTSTSNSSSNISNSVGRAAGKSLGFGLLSAPPVPAMRKADRRRDYDLEDTDGYIAEPLALRPESFSGKPLSTDTSSLRHAESETALPVIVRAAPATAKDGTGNNNSSVSSPVSGQFSKATTASTLATIDKNKEELDSDEDEDDEGDDSLPPELIGDLLGGLDPASEEYAAILSQIKSKSKQDLALLIASRSQQRHASKSILTDQQKIAYVGIVSLLFVELECKLEMRHKEGMAATTSYLTFARSQMNKLYRHMQLVPAEQTMIEKLARHNIIIKDLIKSLTADGDTIEVVSDNALTVVDNTSSDGDNNDSNSSNTDDTIINSGGSDTNNSEESVCEEESKSSAVKIDVRMTAILDLFLLFLTDNTYDSRGRYVLRKLADSLSIPHLSVLQLEQRLTDQLRLFELSNQSNQASSTNESDKIVDMHINIRRKKEKKKRWVILGLATVGGGLVLGLSAGLLAPAIGAGLGAAFTTIGLGHTAIGTFFGSIGGAALITSTGIATGSGMAGSKMAKRIKGLDVFQLVPINENSRLNVIICISGWLGQADNGTLPFSTVDQVMGDLYSILWEPEALRELGDALKLIAGEVVSTAALQVLQHTVLNSLLSALTWPLWLTKLGYLIDNPWSVCIDLAKRAGLILADSLRNRAQGGRPVTLVGFSLGARVIFYALVELGKMGSFGIVEDVYMFGCPVTATADEWRLATGVVGGRFLNAYAKNDWILGFLYRATNVAANIAGLNPIEGINGLENMDITELVPGHLHYRRLMPKLLKHVGFEVTAEEFLDPDEEEEAKKKRRAERKEKRRLHRIELLEQAKVIAAERGLDAKDKNVVKNVARCMSEYESTSYSDDSSSSDYSDSDVDNPKPAASSVNNSVSNASTKSATMVSRSQSPESIDAASDGVNATDEADDEGGDPSTSTRSAADLDRETLSITRRLRRQARRNRRRKQQINLDWDSRPEQLMSVPKPPRVKRTPSQKAKDKADARAKAEAIVAAKYNLPHSSSRQSTLTNSIEVNVRSREMSTSSPRPQSTLATTPSTTTTAAAVRPSVSNESETSTAAPPTTSSARSGGMASFFSSWRFRRNTASVDETRTSVTRSASPPVSHPPPTANVTPAAQPPTLTTAAVSASVPVTPLNRPLGLPNHLFVASPSSETAQEGESDPQQPQQTPTSARIGGGRLSIVEPDLDEIRRELEMAGVTVKELSSTMPKLVIK
ncbi:DUF726-domain-containing protein [Ramicandelaber brevisporus]|nr:DUF726-domain-containing protein [Ramicandelaber brevisporus]